MGVYHNFFDLLKICTNLFVFQRKDNGFANEHGDLVSTMLPGEVPSRRRTPAKVVLGKENLANYAEDVRDMLIPSHLGKPPPKLGHKSQGKLKADEWRSSTGTSIPFSLLRRWGRDPGRRGALLKNFLHLVIAVRIGTLRSITPSDIEKYRFHTQEHLRGLRDLFPDKALTLKQHTLPHIADFFYLFGPAPGMWCFPFERFNGEIADLESNNKSGQFDSSLTLADLSIMYP